MVCKSRWRGRVARWCVVAGVLAGPLVAAGGPAAGAAAAPGYETAFQANTTDLWTYGATGTTSTTLGMMPGTSPAITALTNGSYEEAFQANTGDLWVRNSSGTATNAGLGMMKGTSPAIAALPGGGYEVAFQANTGYLWTYGTAGTKDAGLGMMAGTSPAIATSGTSYQVAFQSNTGYLWTYGTPGSKSAGLGMLKGTSPAITALPSGGYQMAFQANTTDLWTYGTAGTTNTTLGMATATNPTITAPANTGIGSTIVNIAESQVGYQDSPAGTFCNAFSAYWGSGSACSNGLYEEAWCADFAAWAWAKAGVSFTYAWETGDINGGAISFYHWAVAHGTWHAAGSGYTPQPGDVVVYAQNGSYAAHAAVVTSYTPGDAGPNVVNGDWWSSGNGAVVTESDQSAVVSSGVTYPILGYASP